MTGREGRYIIIVVWHAEQNVYLQTEALSLATGVIGAFNDEQVRKALLLDKQYTPL